MVDCLSFTSLQWVLDKQDLMKERQKDIKFMSEEDYWKLQIFFANGISSDSYAMINLFLWENGFTVREMVQCRNINYPQISFDTTPSNNRQQLSIFTFESFSRSN